MRLFLLLALCATYLFSDAHIFLYHRFGDDQYPSTNTTIKELRKQFEYFKTHEYKVVPIEKIIERLKSKKPIPDKWVALTIDDAYKSFYENGLPVFIEYNYPFSIYTQVAGRENKNSSIMHWEQLRELLNYRGSIQLHSYAHDHLTWMSKEEIIQDTQKAITIFQKNMGYVPSIFAYPYGEYDEKVQSAIASFGFDAIVNQNNGSINEKSDLNDLPRIALVGESNLEEKLKYKTLEVNWLEPNTFPSDSILKQVKAKVDKTIKQAKLYVTGHGWRDIQVNDGIIDVKLNLELEKDRTRVIIGSDYFTISNKLIIRNKEKFNVK